MRLKAVLAFAVMLVAMGSLSCGGEEGTQAAASSPKSATQIIRETELVRINALTVNDIDKARSLHADDFQLKAPNGETFTKDEYLDAVGSGRLDYVLWEPISPVEVTIDGDEATVRYRSRIGFAGSFGGTTEQTHDDTYALRDGKWVIVRSVTVFD
jgi:Domain of unknown function (DUF4440)